MKQTSSKNHSVDQSNPVYHDTYRLLKSYRDAVWNLELEVQHVKREFEIEYESSIDDFLESIYLAGADLNGSKLENYAKSIERSNQMLSLLNSAVEILRNTNSENSITGFSITPIFLHSSFRMPTRLLISCALT